jgi:hypothetical protein
MRAVGNLPGSIDPRPVADDRRRVLGDRTPDVGYRPARRMRVVVADDPQPVVVAVGEESVARCESDAVLDRRPR